MSSPSVPPGPGDQVEAAYPSIGTLVKETSTHFSTLLRSELELAKAEVGKEAKKAVTGSVLLIVAGVVALFAVPFVFVTIAELLVFFGLDRWLAYLIVVVFFLLVAGILAFIGIRRFKKVHAPERTVESLKRNAEIGKALKSGQEHGAQEAEAISRG